jgi:hypothetical protein
MQADHVFIGVDDYEQIKQWYIEKFDLIYIPTQDSF